MYAAIKTGGFALGIAACLLIALFIKEELSYDTQYPAADRIYRIAFAYTDNGKTEKGVDVPAPLAASMRKDFPEIEQVGRLMSNNLFPGAGSNEISPWDKIETTHEDGLTYADQGMLDILQFPMVYGDRSHMLTEPRTMVISRRKADKYFPNENPIGKLMVLNEDKTKPYTITGVMENIPANNHLQQYDFLLTLAGAELWKGEQQDWGANNYADYILVRSGTNAEQLSKKMNKDLLYNYYLPNMIREGDKDAQKQIAKAKFYLQPVTDIYLTPDVEDDVAHGDMRFVWLFGAVAAFILIIACINFINLSTAKSANRAKEVGLRKVIGSQRSSLINQFLTESLLFSFLSFAIGIFLAWALMPYFNMLSAKHLAMPWLQWWFAPAMLVSATIVGLAAGLYPSLYLSSFKPIQVLKGQLAKGSKGSVLRNSLVVFQFTTSIILIISTVVIYNQMHFVLNKKVGFNKDQVLLLEGVNTFTSENVKTLKTSLLTLPQVQSVSVSDFLPIAGTKRNGNTFWRKGEENTNQGTETERWEVDEDYFKTLGIKIVEGRDFSPLMKSDSNAVVVNQTLVKQMGIKNPVGKLISNGYTYKIVGVAEDFNFESLHQDIGALVLHLGDSHSMVSVKLHTADMAKTLASVTTTWKKLSPAQPIRYAFLDERFANMYAGVQRMGRTFTSFAVLAIIIACLGLFGLSAFMAEQRSKEIGIRKVLGASVSSITALMSKDFVKLVVIAIVIASPIAWWAMSKWLQDFAYRAPIEWWVFALAGAAAIVIALLTISFQSIKAALMNPVEAIKAE